MEESGPPLTNEAFEQAWSTPGFIDVVRPAATGSERLRYRRFVMEGRIAEAQLEMVRWTKYGVVAAVGASLVALVVGGS